MKRISRLSALVVAALLAGAAALSARAAALDDRVPQESIIYAGWSGSDTLGPAYAKSNLKGIFDASAIKEFVSTQLPKLIDMAAARDPNAPKQIAMMQQGLGVLWRHPTAFYFCPLDYTVPQMPAFRFGIICDVGNDAKATADLLNPLLAQMPQNPMLPVHLVQDGNTLILTFGKADTLDDLKKGGGLAASPAYQAAMKNTTQKSPAFAMYLDFKAGMATLNEGLTKIPNVPADAKQKITATIDALGLNALTQMVAVGGFNDAGGWSAEAFVGINGPHKGIITLMDPGPLSKDALNSVPKDAAAFAVWKMDLGKMYTEARNAIGVVDPQTQKDFDTAMADVNGSIGLNIEKDILAPFGDEWAFYRAPLSDEGGNSPALVVRLKDGATLAKSLAKLEAMYNAIPGAPIKIEKITAAKTEVSTLAFLQYSIAWGVKGDYLYVSSLSGIGGAIRQVEDKGPTVAENPDYKAAMARLPQNVQPSQISYCYPAKLYPELRRAALGLLPVVRRMGVDIPMEILPEGADVAKFMPPGAMIVWSAPDGLHSAGNSAFPGADMLGGQQMGPAAAGMLVGMGSVALPAMARGRTDAGRSVDMANLRGISQSALVYAADHKDAMPDDLARLVADGMISPRTLVSRRAGTPALEMTPELEQLAKSDFAKFSDQVAQHCDYVYIARDTKSEVNAGVIVAYEKPSPATADGLNIAYQDGHVEFVAWSRITGTFDATNEILKKAGKPAIDAKALMRAAGVPDTVGLP